MSEHIKVDLSLDNIQLGVLFALYAVPNMFMPVVVAVLASSAAGLWPSVLLLSTTVAAGAWTAYAGVQLGQFSVLLLGRALFGYVLAD